MKTLTYKPNLTGLTIVKDTNLQNDLVFGNGHPQFLIPDFNDSPCDIWISYEDYIDKTFGTIYDQNGGEIQSYKMIDSSGLMSVDYTLYDISLESDPDDYKEYNITIEGYVVSSPFLFYDGYFLATKVTGDI